MIWERAEYSSHFKFAAILGMEWYYIYVELYIYIYIYNCRMLESSYNILFGKLALKCLFEDYFEEASHFTTRIMLKPIDDPHVDFIATVSIPHCSSSLFYNFLLLKLCYFTIRHALYDLWFRPYLGLLLHHKFWILSF
jgi:hypothetical protein